MSTENREESIVDSFKVNLYQSLKPIFEHVGKNIDAYNEIVEEEAKLKDEEVFLKDTQIPGRVARNFLLMSKEEMLIVILGEQGLKEGTPKGVYTLAKEVVLMSLASKHFLTTLTKE